MRFIICEFIYRRTRDLQLGSRFFVLFINGIAAYKAPTRGELIDVLEGMEDVTA